MANNLETSHDLKIPDEELGRQAVGTLRGYIYQIYQSLAAWLAIKKDETLFLKVAEDFAVLAKDAWTGTQVKMTPPSGSVTLNTKSVLDVIKSLWNFQNANEDEIICINYLTTANIGKEKKLTFPDGHCGLTYWRLAARDGSDIEPLRKALLSIGLPAEISNFIKTAIPERLRDRILSRINWICGQQDLEAISQTISDRLVYLGEQKGFAPSESERVKDCLIAKILKTIACTADRKLTRAELLRVVEKSASISIPMSTVRTLTGTITGLPSDSAASKISLAESILRVHEIPLPLFCANRPETISKLAKK